MRLFRWSKKSARPPKGFLLYVTRDEALLLVESLARQLRTGSANDGRAEHSMADGSYFSAVVDNEKAREAD